MCDSEGLHIDTDMDIVEPRLGVTSWIPSHTGVGAVPSWIIFDRNRLERQPVVPLAVGAAFAVLRVIGVALNEDLFETEGMPILFSSDRVLPMDNCTLEFRLNSVARDPVVVAVPNFDGVVSATFPQCRTVREAEEVCRSGTSRIPI